MRMAPFPWCRGRRRTQLETARGKFGDLQAAQEDSTDTSVDAGAAYLQASEDAAALTDQVLELVAAINEANGTGQDAVTTNAAYQEALAGVGERVQSLKDDYVTAHGSLDGFNLSLDQNTLSGASNAASLAEVAGKAQAAAKAQYDMDVTTMGAKAATDKYVATLGTNRQAFIDGAVAAGYNKDEVVKLADQVYGLPSKKEIDILASTASASRQVDGFIAGIPKSILVNIVANPIGGSGRPQIKQANGGVVDYYANGGLAESHVAQIAPAGAMRVWAEPETGGEAYIPLASSKRARSLAIWEETGRRLKAFANGGFDGPAAPVYMSSGGGDVNVMVSSKGGVDLLKYVDVRVERADKASSQTLRAGSQRRF
jgi:hypothetical protein